MNFLQIIQNKPLIAGLIALNIVIAAQAFHWFDREKFREECQRLLKPGAKVALFWNERLIDAITR